MKFLWRISILMMLVIALSPAANAAPGDVKWTYTDGTNLLDLAIGPDGTIYVTSVVIMPVQVTPLPTGGTSVVVPTTNYVIALTPQGHQKWKTSDTGQYLSVRSDGKIISSHSYIHSPAPSALSGGGTFGGNLTSNKLYSLESDGSRWLSPIDGGRVALGADNSIVVLNLSSHATSPTNVIGRIGTMNTEWTPPTIPSIIDTPVIGSDGTVYCITFPRWHMPGAGGLVYAGPDWGNTLLAYSTDGRLKRQLHETDHIYSTPSIGQNGDVFLVTKYGVTNGSHWNFEWSIRRLSHDLSHEYWEKTSDYEFGRPVIDSQNNCYISNGRTLYCFTPAGEEKCQAFSFDIFSPALASDGIIYQTGSYHLTALDSADLAYKWGYFATAAIRSAPMIGPDGTIYFIAGTNTLIALEGTAPPANAPWPQDRHDAQRTSRATQASTGGLSRNVDGKFSLSLNLEPGRAYKVEASEDLLTWTEIGSFTSSGSAQTFLDETSAGKPQRFYRLVVP